MHHGRYCSRTRAVLLSILFYLFTVLFVFTCPLSYRRCNLHVSVEDLKRLFHDDEGKIAVGKKGDMVGELVHMLYFDYTLETEVRAASIGRLVYRTMSYVVPSIKHNPRQRRTYPSTVSGIANVPCSRENAFSPLISYQRSYLSTPFPYGVSKSLRESL